MNIPTRRFAFGLAIVALNLAGLACSSSTPLKSTSDAAVNRDLGAGDLSVRDASTDVAGLDLAAQDPDVLATPDAPSFGTDVVLADLSAGKDLPPSDLPAGNDTTDLPVTAADVHASDIPIGDVPPSDGGSRDGTADGVWGCKSDAGGLPTCNDDPMVSAIMGTCQPDGTCLCTSSYVINPGTGRCMIPPRDASVHDDASTVAACTGEYNACGCGCCDGVSSTVQCYYPSLGETITAITAQDQATKNATNCDLAGCSVGIRHVCCAEPTPESPSSATYKADSYSGGLEHVAISKSGSDCARLSFARPMTGASSSLKITMPLTWGVVSSEFGACGDAGVMDQAKGGVGSFVLRASGNLCLVDLHATLFAFLADGTVKSSRLDVDGLSVTGMPGYSCR